MVPADQPQSRRGAPAARDASLQIAGQDGRASELLAKFIEPARDAADEPRVRSHPSRTWYVFEVWSKEAEWQRARTSDAITTWSKGMPALVAEWPKSVQLDSIDGKGI